MLQVSPLDSEASVVRHEIDTNRWHLYGATLLGLAYFDSEEAEREKQKQNFRDKYASAVIAAHPPAPVALCVQQEEMGGQQPRGGLPATHVLVRTKLFRISGCRIRNPASESLHSRPAEKSRASTHDASVGLRPSEQTS